MARFLLVRFPALTTRCRSIRGGDPKPDIVSFRFDLAGFRNRSRVTTPVFFVSILMNLFQIRF
jgi:hypothetical protein